MSDQNLPEGEYDDRENYEEDYNQEEEQMYEENKEREIEGELRKLRVRKEGEELEMTIEIVRQNFKKPYLGGFKNLKSGLIYHHAFAQTDQYRTEHKVKYTRESQTYDYSTKSTKVKREIGTQMEREGIFLDVRSDKMMEPKSYFTSEMWEERREEAALFIQRLVRGMLAYKKTDKLRKEKENKKKDQLQKEEEFRKNEEVKHKKEIERRMHPRSKEDFTILYDELELWRTNEIQKIKENKSLKEQEKKVALKQILDKETELLQTIDRLKINANKENKEEKINQFLKAMSDPKKWLRSDGRFTEVHTAYTTRAKELMDIYHGLKMRNLTIDERLDILLNTKWTLKECQDPKKPTPLIEEIQELIDREADMINRGRSEKSLEGLRQRIANMFLQFIEKPEFNPEAHKFQKIPFDILLDKNEENR